MDKANALKRRFLLWALPLAGAAAALPAAALAQQPRQTGTSLASHPDARHADLAASPPWVKYTPVFTGFGRPTSVGIWSKRAGDTLLLRGSFSSGRSSASEARMTMGVNGTEGGILSDADKVPSIQFAGAAAFSVVGAGSPHILIESHVGYLTFAIQSAGRAGLAAMAGDSFIAAGTVISFTAEVPIAGW